MTPPLDELLRVEGARVLATLIRDLGDIDVAQDALQDAVETALIRWRSTAPPDNVAAWLHMTARRKAIDRIRREAKRSGKERQATELLAQTQDDLVADDPLRLFFTCCHPSLSRGAQVALSLRTLGGLSTSEIARVTLATESAVTRRLTRAKTKIRQAQIPYRLPHDDELPPRLDSVLAVISAIFTTGHHSPHGHLAGRISLTEEGIRLARMLVELLPDAPEAKGLLALLLTTHARALTRLDGDGRSVPFPEQQRARWDQAAIAEATAVLSDAMRAGDPGQYQLQAAIACLHSEAATYEATDWPQIVYLYRLLERKASTPVVRVNRAIAEAELFGPKKGLDLLEDLSNVEHWHSYWAARGRFLSQMGLADAAVDALDRALALPVNDQERVVLQSMITELSEEDRPRR